MATHLGHVGRVGSITFTRPGASPTPAPEPEPAGTTWDPTAKSSGVTLSGGNLTASTAEAFSEHVAGTTVRTTGARMFKGVPIYTGPNDWGEIGWGITPEGYVVPPGPDMDGGLGPLALENDAILVISDGSVYTDNGTTYVTGKGVIHSGQNGFQKIDFDTGYFWLDDALGTFAADAEAGINPHAVFAPNTAMKIVAEIVSSNGDTVSITIDPTVSEGRFGSWDS